MQRTPLKGTTDALLIVDVQQDFCPGGALAVSEGDQVVPVLNEWIAAAEQAGALIVASRDWHPPRHVSFEERGGPWPVHCVRGTAGAELHPDLQLPGVHWLVNKGAEFDRDAYSPFDRTGLAERLKRSGVERLWIGGLAQDVCVRAAVLDARSEGFETHLILPATRAVNVNPGDGKRAVAEMRQAGAIIENGDET